MLHRAQWDGQSLRFHAIRGTAKYGIEKLYCRRINRRIHAVVGLLGRIRRTYAAPASLSAIREKKKI